MEVSRRRMLQKVALLVATAMALLTAFPTRASADWLITPFLGTTFGGESPFLDPELSAGSAKTIFGGSVALLSRGVFGVEADFGESPRFFERDSRGGLITSSNLATFTGNIVLALPLGLTRESLRPYVVAGGGLIHAASNNIIGFESFDRTLSALDVGGGAIGMISTRTGFRFDLRHFRSLYAQDLLLPTTAHLSFWRATVGVTLRY